jgi:hypothetical protein
MKHITKTIFTMALLALFAKSLPAQSGSFEVATNGSVSSACGPGESVSGTSKVHFDHRVTPDAVNGNRYQIDIANNFSGAGQATQAQYSAAGSFGYEFISLDSPAQVSISISTHLDPEGKKSQLMLRQVLNITVDTSGSISANVVESSIECSE